MMSLSNSLPMRRNKIPPQKTGLLPRPRYVSRGTGAKRFHALSTRVEGTNGIYPLGKGKGDGDHQVKDARDIAHKARAERAEVEELREQMGALHAIVEKQAAQLSQQSKTMELLRLYMKGRQSPMIEAISEEEKMAKSRFLNTALTDRRSIGMFDTRYHSASSGATPKDFRILPQRIILVRHAESEGNVDNSAYTYLPDPQVPLTPKGWKQAMEAGESIRKLAMCDEQEGCVVRMYDNEDERRILEHRVESDLNATSTMRDGAGNSLRQGKGSEKKMPGKCRLFFYTSPYLRSKQTYEGIAQAFCPEEIAGVQEEVQLREQDFGNFQDAEGKKREKAERLRFGRFFYRFPHGESGADVYDRMTLFEDHLVRDINAGRFAGDSSLVLVTHGLALRIFLMRWFHWTVDQFMGVFNPPNAIPLVLERVTDDEIGRPGGPVAWIHTKALYKLTPESMDILQGCTPDMCTTSWLARGLGGKQTQEPRPEVHEMLEPMEGESTR